MYLFKIFGLLFIQNLLILKVSCSDCICSEKDNNENECKLCDNCQFFYIDQTCVECSISLTSEAPYYKNINTDSFWEAVNLESINNYKLIYGTKEVVESCPTEGGYKFTFYDICHKSKPYNSEENPSNSNNYECPKAYYKEALNGIDYYTCYSTDNCPSSFKYYTSSPKQCLNSCDKTMKKKQNGDSYISRCDNNCFKNDTYYEVEYEEIKTNGNIRHCLDKCPSNYKYYYTQEIIEGETRNVILGIIL